MRQGRGVMPGPADTYLGYGLSWANASNTPFREYKHWVHEGGIATPLIAHWPRGIAADQRGKLDHQPGHLIDIMATCADVGGAKYPNTFRGEPITPLEGTSLRPAFEGKDLGRTSPIFWEHEGNCALRDGTWKIVGLVVDGNETNKENLKNLIVVNAPDGTWSLRSEGKEVSKGGSTIDPTKKPKTIDFTPTSGGGNGKEYLGIYQLGKNRRKLCFAAAEYGRPAKFSSETGSRSILVTFQRIEAE